MVIRRATKDDIKDLVQVRIDFLIMDKGHLSIEDETTIRTQSEKYFNKHIELEDFVAIVAEIDNKIVSTAFLVTQERPANTSCPTGLTGTLLNVVTYPKYRKKGIATKVLQTIIEEAKKMNVSSVDLSATKDGKPIYEKLGFSQPLYTSMRLKL